jgi:hypothetical protein
MFTVTPIYLNRKDLLPNLGTRHARSYSSRNNPQEGVPGSFESGRLQHLKIGAETLYGATGVLVFFRSVFFDSVPTEEDLSHGCYAL